MAEYRIKETGQIVTESEFRALHENTSFPPIITVEMANDFGADIILQGPQPTATRYQVVYRDGVYEEEGLWFTKHSVVDMDDDAKALVDSATRDLNRLTRNKKLSDCDWVRLDDVPLTDECKAEFAVYRQALRDIDLLNPEWPEVPVEVWID